MQVRLLYHVGQEMRLLSNIIKGERIRNQTIINLTNRMPIKEVKHQSKPILEVSLEGPPEEDQALEQEVFSIHEEAQMKADSLLEEATSQANEILNRAFQEASMMRENAEIEKVNLLAEAVAAKEHIINEAELQRQQIIEEANEEKSKRINETEGEMVDVLSTLLEYLIGEEIYHRTDWLTCVVKKMLSKENFKDEIKILVSPTLFEKLTEKDKEELEGISKNMVIESDTSLTDTACQVLTEQGTIEYDVQQGLNKVISDLTILKNVKQEPV